MDTVYVRLNIWYNLGNFILFELDSTTLKTRELLAGLRNELDEAEQKRLHHFKRTRPYRILFNIIGLLTLLAVGYAIFDPDEGGAVLGIAWIPFMLMLIIYGVIQDKEKGKFKHHFQQHVVARIIPKIGSGFSYQTHGGFPVSRLEESQLFRTFRDYSSEDFITGRVNGKVISFAEVKLEWRGGTDDAKSRTVFKGIYAEVKLNKRLASSCWLLPKKKSIEGATIVKLEEGATALLGKYRLYAENESFAKGLFTSKTLQRLMDLNQDLRNRKAIWGNVGFAFMGDSLRLSMDLRRKFLEPELSNPVNTEAFLEKELAVIEVCTSLVNLLQD